MSPVRLVVPVPIWFSAPVPEMALATVMASERLNASVPPLVTTAPVPRVPMVPPLPTWRVPSVIVVVPE